MFKTTALLLVAALAAGCAIPIHSVRNEDSAKLVVGQTVVLHSEAVIVECQPFDSWIASAKTKACIQRDALSDEKVLGKLPAGTSLVLRRMKYVDAFDQEYRFVYLRNPSGGEDLVAHDFNLFELLGMARERSW